MNTTAFVGPTGKTHTMNCPTVQHWGGGGDRRGAAPNLRTTPLAEALEKVEKWPGSECGNCRRMRAKQARANQTAEQPQESGPMTEKEIKALKLSPTMIRSLRNVAEAPVGDWLRALNARKVNGHSTYALLDRGLIEKASMPCTPDGCGCERFNPENAHLPAVHLVITSAGKRVLAS